MDSDSGLDVPDGGLDTDSDASSFPFQLSTFRNFIYFFLDFGWTAIALNGRYTPSLGLIIATLIRIALVAAVRYFFYFMSKMEQSGTIETSNAISCKW